MRVAFIGKGGSGKSTVSAGMIRHEARKGNFVVAVDADINRHLGFLLKVPSLEVDLGSRIQEVFQFLEGQRLGVKDLGRVPELGSLPPDQSSRLVKFSKSDEFFEKFSSVNDNIALITAGTYEDEDKGTTCIHAKLKVIELFTHRLLDQQNDLVVFDVTAGTDPLSTTLVFGFDLHVVVVEPTKKSIQVFKDYFESAVPVRDRIFVVANKVRDEGDLAFIKQHIQSDKILGVLSHSTHLKDFDRGNSSSFDMFVDENRSTWNRISEHASLFDSRRTEGLAGLHAAFVQNCHSWANTYYGVALNEIFGGNTSSLAS